MSATTLRLLTAIGLLVLSASPALPAGATGRISGIAAVRDGDGLLFGDVEVRLQGIAAPEDNRVRVELGGKEATANLRRLAEGRNVVCELDGTFTRGRPVGVCFVDGLDVGEKQVADGFARDCPRFSSGRYRAAEERAMAKGASLSRVYSLPSYCVPRSR